MAKYTYELTKVENLRIKRGEYSSVKRGTELLADMVSAIAGEALTICEGGITDISAVTNVDGFYEIRLVGEKDIIHCKLKEVRT